MKKITVINELTLESFRNFGTFQTFINPDRPHLGSFYRDMAVLHTSDSSDIGFSMVNAPKKPFMITSLENHSKTGEVVFPLDGDVLINVATASRSERIPADIPIDKIEVFRVPKMTMVILDKGVWHSSPFAYKSDCVNILVVTPERTYANDCFHYIFPEEDRIEIEVK